MHSKRFAQFAGVDFSLDPTLISAHRSPDAINMIPDSDGHPEKRVGYRKVATYNSKINGIFEHSGKILIHSGNSIYIDNIPIITDINDGKSSGIIFDEKLWILTGEDFLVYDGENIRHVRDIATVPQVLSQCDNYLNNGFTYQSFNMLTTRRRIGITVPDGGMNIIYISQEINSASVNLFYRESGKEIPIKGVYKRAEGDWYLDLKETLNPRNIPDEVILEYELAEKREKILEKCTFMASFDNRLFLGGNPDYPNTDFYSETMDGAYFTDLSYTGIGTMDETPQGEFEKISDGAKIVGYSYVGNSLCIHKSGGEGASLYMRTRHITEEGAIYPITAGITGESAIGGYATLNDDPLYLTSMGVFAVGSQDITGEKCVRSRSSRINPKLINEENLENAVSCTWNGYYMLFVNGRVYIADSRAKSYPRNQNGDFEYEWYLWSNIPAKCVLSANGTVYFGDIAGNLYRLNNDMTDPHGGYLMTAYNDDGAPIFARWSTKMEDDGDFTVKKLMLRRGSGVYAKTYASSSVGIRVRTERDFGKVTNYKKLGIFSFKNLNFANFTFNTYPFSFIPLGRKIKDYRMVQVIVENGELNECMGIIGIEWHYKKGGFAK